MSPDHGYLTTHLLVLRRSEFFFSLFVCSSARQIQGVMVDLIFIYFITKEIRISFASRSFIFLLL